MTSLPLYITLALSSLGTTSSNIPVNSSEILTCGVTNVNPLRIEFTVL